MNIDEKIKECQETLEKLVNKKITGVKFKPYNNDCWRLYLDTNKGKIVMTVCSHWDCPVMEYRTPKQE